MSEERATQYPHVNLWLDGAASDHPLVQSDVDALVYDALENILAPIEDAAPLRIARKRDAFRSLRSSQGFLEQRAELLVASMLARAKVSFDFAKDHPDLLIANGAAGIEVGTRAIDGPWDLRDRLVQRLDGRTGLAISLDFIARPLKLPQDRIGGIVEEILRADLRGDGASLSFPDVGLVARFSSTDEPKYVDVLVTFNDGLGVDLTHHMAQVEREIDNKISEKGRQADKVPTLLLLDFARVGWAWLRTQSWLPVLQARLAGTPFAGLGLMVSSLDRDVPMQLHIHCKPGSSAELEETLDRLTVAFNLTSIA